MRKFLTALGVVAFLSVSAWGTALANSQVVTNTTDQVFNAVGEVSSTLTAAPFAELSIFLGGIYQSTNTLVLQQEKGSPGSGVFENVLTLTGGTANARFVNTWPNGPNRTGYRLLMTATGTGAISATLTDHDVTARPLSTFYDDPETYVGPLFDDFYISGVASATVLDVNLWLTNDGGGNRGTEMVVADLEEGGGTIISGTTDTDGACLSTKLTEWGGLPTDGWIITEARFRLSTLNGFVFAGLADIACANDDLVTFQTTTTAVTANTGYGALAGIGMDDDGTIDTSWYPMTAILDVEGANAEVMAMATTVAANFVTLRTEIDTHGNSYHYVDGVLLHAEALAVGVAGLRLLPWFEVGATSSTTAITGTLDYIFFTTTRPAT